MIRKLLYLFFPKECREIEMNSIDSLMRGWLKGSDCNSVLIYNDDDGITYRVKIIFEK